MYQFYVENLRSIQLALNQVETLAKIAIKEEKPLVLASLLRTHIFLLGAWTECRLLKLINEPVGFSQNEQNSLKALRTQKGKWEKAIGLGFKKHYKVTTLTGNTLNSTAWLRYNNLNEALKNEIEPIIQLRNRLAHGQWKNIFNNKGTKLSQDFMQKIADENLLSSKYKFKMVEHIAQIIHDLVVSGPTFERDFDKHYKFFLGVKINLNNRSYEKYRASLVANYQRGLKRKKKNFLKIK